MTYEPETLAFEKRARVSRNYWDADILLPDYDVLVKALKQAETALDISLGHRCEDCGKCKTSREVLGAIRAALGRE